MREKLQLENKLKEEKIVHKQGVIDNLVESVKLKTQRQFLNEIVRMNVPKIRERWTMLYRCYEQNKHINLKVRIESYNLTHKPKIRSTVKYIDEVLNDIPLLYKLAVKLFESDFKNRMQKYINAL